MKKSEEGGKTTLSFGKKGQSGRWGLRAGLSAAKEARGEAATSRNVRRQSGRWRVAQAYNCHSILDAIATLIEAQRFDLAIVLIKQDVISGN